MRGFSTGSSFERDGCEDGGVGKKKNDSVQGYAQNYALIRGKRAPPPFSGVAKGQSNANAEAGASEYLCHLPAKSVL